MYVVMNVRIYLHVCLHGRVCMCVCVLMYVFTDVHVCMCICMCVCVYACMGVSILC